VCDNFTVRGGEVGCQLDSLLIECGESEHLLAFELWERKDTGSLLCFVTPIAKSERAAAGEPGKKLARSTALSSIARYIEFLFHQDAFDVLRLLSSHNVLCESEEAASNASLSQCCDSNSEAFS